MNVCTIMLFLVNIFLWKHIIMLFVWKHKNAINIEHFNVGLRIYYVTCIELKSKFQTKNIIYNRVLLRRFHYTFFVSPFAYYAVLLAQLVFSPYSMNVKHIAFYVCDKQPAMLQSCQAFQSWKLRHYSLPLVTFFLFISRLAQQCCYMWLWFKNTSSKMFH